MKTKFTAGKWHKRNGDADNFAEIVGDMGTNKTICLLPKKCFVDKDEAKANAELIELAPELLSVLDQLVSRIDENWELFCSGTQNGIKTALLAESKEILNKFN